MTTRWFQIEIEDDSALSGRSLARLVRTVADTAPVTVVGFMGAEGAGPGFRAKFPEGRLTILELERFTERLNDVAQFDWGDFLLTRTESDLCGLQPAKYEDILPRTVAVIRAVDDTYFYVYTRDMKVARAILDAYPEAISSERKMSSLEFPE